MGFALKQEFSTFLKHLIPNNKLKCAVTLLLVENPAVNKATKRSKW